MLTGENLRGLQHEAERMTYERARAEAMGFRFSDIAVYPAVGTVQLTATLTCVCGRKQRFASSFLINEGPPIAMQLDFIHQRINVARGMQRIGAFTRDHLLQDGYTPEQCDEIEERGRRFDEECRAAVGTSRHPYYRGV